MSKKQTEEETENSGRVKIGDHVVIYPRGKRRTWTADFHFVDADGRRQHGRRSLGTRNGRIAKSKAWELEQDLASGELKPAAESEAPEPIGSAITKFIESKRTDGRSRKTLVKYEGELRNFARFAEEKQGIRMMPRLSVKLFDAYKVHRRDVDQLDSYTVYNHFIILKTWLKWCKKRGHVQVNPLADVEVPEPRRRRHPAATLEQVNAVLARASGETLAVLAMLAFADLRVGEAVALRPTDVDLKQATLRVQGRGDWGPKTAGSERDVPIHPRLLAILAAKRKGRGGWFFNAPPSNRFPNGDHHLNSRDVNEEFQKLAKACGFAVGRNERALTLHALRRFFKTFCLDAGVPKPMVDAWMGHQDQADMDTFYYSPQKSKEWMERVPFGGPDENEVKRVRPASSPLGE